jgi:hypothetical protein
MATIPLLVAIAIESKYSNLCRVGQVKRQESKVKIQGTTKDLLKGQVRYFLWWSQMQAMRPLQR